MTISYLFVNPITTVRLILRRLEIRLVRNSSGYAEMAGHPIGAQRSVVVDHVGAAMVSFGQ